MAEMKILDVNAVSGKKVRLKDYSHILAYHACRSTDAQSYRVHGLKPFSQVEALEQAVQKLESDRLDRSRIESEFYPLWAKVYKTEPPQVWAMLNTEEFMDVSTHYLIYGSEFMNALAMRLGCRDKLSKIGKPMIIKCAIPISDIPSIWLQNLEQSILEQNADDRSLAVRSVTPECIIDILYPAGYVCDPYTNMIFKLG